MLAAIVCVLAGYLLSSIPSAYLLTPAVGAFSANRSRQRRVPQELADIEAGTPDHGAVSVQRFHLSD